MTIPPLEVGLDAFPFHFHGEVFGFVTALVVFYVYGVRVLAERYGPSAEPAVTRRQIAWFATGIVVFTAVETWPIHDIGEGSLFTFHMVGHLAVALIVPPALLKGIPGWLIRFAVRPILSVVRTMTKPLPAILFFNTVLALLHVPSVLEATLRSEPVHFSFHMLLLVSATLMWWPVIGPIPDLPKLAPPYAMGYLFVQSLVPTIPASFMTFATSVTYKVYGTFPRLWGLDAQTDQLIAGLIMKIGGGIVLWTAITVIWFRWAAAEERLGNTKTGALLGS